MASQAYIARWRRTLLVVSTSGLALCLAAATDARAQCAPDPTVTNGTSTCNGTDPNGILINTSNTTLVVTNGATVTNNGGPAVTVDVPASAQPYGNRTVAVSVAGTVDGNGQPGIALRSGSAGAGTYDYYGTRATITVANGARVTGSSGITVGASAGNSYGAAIATVDNAGSITGTGGLALLSTTPALAGFASITNRATGTIGAISGPVGTLANAGLIDGGANSAVATGTVYNSGVGSGAWVNSGVIQSAGTTATIAGAFLSFTNTGTVSNSSTGIAITGGPVVNSGRITTAGMTALSGPYLSLVNTGRIDGGIVATATMQYQVGSTIDSSQGTINGDVTLGAGDDVLVARYNGTATPVTGINGAVDGGAGTDTLRLVFDAATTITAPVQLPTNFEQLGLAPVANVTATLGTGFSNTGTVVLSGNGTVVNAGTLTGAGPVVVLGGLPPTYPTFNNQGTIRSTGTVAGQYAVSFNGGGNALANAGTITAIADAVLANGYSFANTGTISAGGTAVSSSSTTFSNAGLIRSTGGTALVLSGSSGAGYIRTNDGRIDGAAAGVNLSTTLVNRGIITSAGAGVLLQSYGQIDNRAGATITGSSIAVTPAYSSSLFNAAVLNAGTINGDVNLGGGGGVFSNNRYFALTGGVLNGDLTLSTGSFFITQLVNTGPGQFAGINGTVRGNGGGLVYQVTADAAAAFTPGNGFASIGYELFNGAKVTLTGSGTSGTAVTFAGTGSADLAANLTATTAPAISVTSLQTASGYSGTPSTLAITSRGSLTLTRTSPYSGPSAAVSLGSGTTFTNAGTITVRDQAPVYNNRIAAVSNGSVVNTGTIAVAGAIGVVGAPSLTNGGSIVQLAGEAAAVGVENVGTLVNTGTISVGGVAVDTTTSFYSPVAITNAAGGTIAGGGGTAIAIQYGQVALTNAGTITGDVRLLGGPSTVSNAGAITGNVTLGFGDDQFVQRVGGTVSGVVDGAAGRDSYVVDTTGGTTSLAASGIANFESVTQTGPGVGSYSGRFGVATIALGQGTLAVAAGQSLATAGATTVTGVAGGGDLAVVNAGTIAGNVVLATGNNMVVNTGTIGGAVQLGAGDDTYVEGAGSIARGGVDGGGGTNLYRAVLAGDRTGIGARTNFQNLALDGTGTLGLTLDQSFQTVALNGAGVSLTMGGYTVGQIVATSDAAARLSFDGAVGSVMLGAGDDTLTLLSSARVAGSIDGGAGTDAIVLDGAAAATLASAQVVNFENGVKQGSGNWSLTGTTPASPTSWAVNAGTLTVAGGNAIADNAAVAVAAGATFALQAGETINTLTGGGIVALGTNTLTVGAANGSGSFAGGISGAGSLVKTGSGSLTLTGANSFTGLTSINGGRLAVNGSLASSVLVNAGAVLGGSGVVGAVTVANGGTFAPGNSIGTTSVVGNVTFAPGSTYQVEANAAGMADRINVGGVAMLGGSVQVLAAPGSYNPLTSYTVLSAAGGVSGRFAGVTSNLAFLTPFLSYGATSVTLLLGRNDISFASQAASPSGVAVANAIAARGLGDPIYDAVLVQTTAGAGTTFDQLSGEIHATIPMVMIDSDRRVRDAVLERGRERRSDGPSLWLQSMDTRAHSRAQGGRADFRTDRIGVYGGADYVIANFRVGLNGGYFDDGLRDPNVYSRAEIGTELIGASASYTGLDNRLSLGVGVTHGWHHAGTTRVVTTANLAGSYVSRSTLQTTQVFGEAGYRLLAGPVELTPFVTIARDRLHADAFAESGGVATLTVAGDRRTVTTGSAGARIAAAYPIATGWLLQPHLSLAYLRNWGTLRAQRMELLAGAGPTFAVAGDRLGRDNADVNGGLDLLAGANIHVGISGYTTRSSQWRDYGGKAAVSVTF